MSKDSKMMRKEIRKIAKEGAAKVNPKEVIREFIDQALGLSLWKRIKLAVGLVIKKKGIMPMHLTINEIRDGKGLPPLILETGKKVINNVISIR